MTCTNATAGIGARSEFLSGNRGEGRRGWSRRDVATGGLELLELPGRWLARAGELLDSYRDLPLGLVDATVVAATEMLREPKLVTLDRRHFSVVRPAHVSSLTLLP